MQGLKIFFLIAAACLINGSLHADIYEWTDANGVRHFTNYAPPDDATILMKTNEVPYDEAADRARMEADRQYQREYQLELARLELAAKEAEIERREAAAERIAAEAERYAQETELAAKQYLDDARNGSYYYRGGGYYGYYGPPYVSHHRRKYREISHYRHPPKKYGSKYRPEKHAYPQKYQSPYNLRSRTQSAHSAYRVNIQSRGNMGSGHSRRGSSGGARR